MAPLTRRTILGAVGAAAIVGGTPAPARADDGTAAVDVRAFGAAGDGERDDTAAVVAALQAAFDRSEAANRDRPMAERRPAAVVVLPAGTYRCPGLADAQLRVLWPIALRGDGAARLELPVPSGDAGPDDDPVLRVAAALDVGGLTMVGGGRWFDLSDPHPDEPDGELALVRLAGCTFERCGAPLWASTATNPVARLVLDANLVVGEGGRRSRTRGLVFPTHGFRSATVTGNRVEAVLQYGIRVGADVEPGDPEPYDTQLDVVCTGNSVTGVWQDRGSGSQSTNGIRVQARRAVVSGNVVTDVANGDDSEVEGIYTKGRTMVISGNVLLDAGRSQGQLVCKASDVLISGNRVEFVDATAGDGIRVEGVEVQVIGNEVVGTPAGFAAIGLNGKSASSLVVASNVVRGGRPERGVVTDARRTVVIRDNTFLGLDCGSEVVGVWARTVDDEPTTVAQVVVRGNVVADCTAALDGACGVRLVAASRCRIGTAVIDGNTFASPLPAVRLERAEGATFDEAIVVGNTYVGVETRLSNPGEVATTVQDFGA